MLGCLGIQANLPECILQIYRLSESMKNPSKSIKQFFPFQSIIVDQWPLERPLGFPVSVVSAEFPDLHAEYKCVSQKNFGLVTPDCQADLNSSCKEKFDLIFQFSRQICNDRLDLTESFDMILWRSWPFCSWIQLLSDMSSSYNNKLFVLTGIFWLELFIEESQIRVSGILLVLRHFWCTWNVCICFFGVLSTSNMHWLAKETQLELFEPNFCKNL